MKDNYVEDLLANTKQSLIETYLELQTYFENKYGEDTLVMMEVGSFFEVYGVDNETEKIGKPKEIADILNIQLTRKNKSIKENSVKNPLMAGFPSVSFDRYIERIVKEEKYTIVLVRQKGAPPKVERYVDTILSPGIHVDYHLDNTENFVASIVIDMNNGMYATGYSAIDVTTGKTYLAETHSTKDDPTFALDELFRLLQSHHTSEVIITTLSADIDTVNLLEYLETEHVHQNTQRAPIKYQNELFKRAYVVTSFLSPIEFLDIERQPLTSESLAILIEFIVEHDHNVIEGLRKPVHITADQYVYLGNNPLEQLNIISKDPHEYTILKHMDKTVTSMGRRLFKNRLLNPITNEDKLNSRYDLTEALSPISSKARRTLQSMYDLERLNRRIHLGKLHPFEINFLLDSLESSRSLSTLLTDATHAEVDTLTSLDTQIAAATGYITDTFNTDVSASFLRSAIDTSFFNTGVHAELDELTASLTTLEDKLTLIQQKFESLLSAATGKPAEKTVDIKQLDKDGHHLCMTKSRFALVQTAIKEAFLSIDGTVHALSDFRYKQQTNTVKITAPIIDQISEDIVLAQTKTIALVKSLYADTLTQMSARFGELLHSLVDTIAKIDVAQSNAHTAKEYVLTRPTILERAETSDSFISLQALRHPLVEAREEHGIYVPNSIVIGDVNQITTADNNALFTETDTDTRGVLLYGINSSGKSSLMKSIGVAVLLAQAGCYVPANNMRFTLVQELFTRIVSRDDFEKGLSSFAVEMVELKNIFNRATDKSLILGDEISHGTETLSAISIVSATILRMIEAKSLFVFTTHLHQLMDVPAIKDVPHMEPAHLQVHYDTEQDLLVFDRTLQAGSGSSVYGLEFAQSLHMDESFLKHAMKIRKELAGELSDIELITRRNTSKYNSGVYLTTCAICNKGVDDTHHISEQHTADDAGKIQHIDKDHTYNLLPICKSCHDDIHAGKTRVQGFVMTSEGLKLSFEQT